MARITNQARKEPSRLWSHLYKSGGGTELDMIIPPILGEDIEEAPYITHTQLQ